MRRHPNALLLGLAFAGLLSCSGKEPCPTCTDPEPDPVPGTLRVLLTVPTATSDVALRLNVHYGQALSIHPASGPQGRIAGGTTSDGAMLVLFAPFASGEVATLAVPDTRDLSRYTIRVEETADASYQVRTQSLGEYAASLTR